MSTHTDASQGGQCQLAVVVDSTAECMTRSRLNSFFGWGVADEADSIDVEDALPQKKRVKSRHDPHLHHHHPHFYHPVSFVTGRSGAVMIANAWQGPHNPSDSSHHGPPPAPPPSRVH